MLLNATIFDPYPDVEPNQKTFPEVTRLDSQHIPAFLPHRSKFQRSEAKPWTIATGMTMDDQDRTCLEWQDIAEAVEKIKCVKGKGGQWPSWMASCCRIQPG